MKIQFLGAAGTVTGSSYILTSSSGQSILIDLGMFQGLPEVDELNYQPYQGDCAQLSGALLTHAHLDHCGRLPIIIPKGFSQNIYMTSATRELTELSLVDTAKIARQDDRPILFDHDLVIKTFDHFKNVAYREPFDIGDFTITYRDAGHILGSASLEIVDNCADSDVKKIIFSGDLGNSPEDLVRDMEYLDHADVVVMESTYGDRLHPTDDAIEAVRREINTVEHTGGTLLIPAFALERTQELLHMIMHLKNDGKIDMATPVFMDSPMGNHATGIYRRYKSMFNVHIQEDMGRADPFGFSGLEVIDHQGESQNIHHINGPKVIIAGSGMMTGGRILHHAAHYLPMPATRLLIVGYQGEGTIGRELLEGAREIVVDGQPVQVAATISDTQSMSSHADQSQLMKWLGHIKGVKKVILTHGEDTSRTALSARITQELGISEVALPMLGQTLEF